MTNPQHSFRVGATDFSRELRPGRIVRLGRHGGEVRVLSGRVWLTSPGDLDDHVLAAGESLRIDRDGPTLLEAWDDAAPARFAWRPRSLAERTRSVLAHGCAAVLHNARAAAGAVLREDRLDDSDQRQRPDGPAREAGGCAAGAA